MSGLADVITAGEALNETLEVHLRSAGKESDWTLDHVIQKKVTRPRRQGQGWLRADVGKRPSQNPSTEFCSHFMDDLPTSGLCHSLPKRMHASVGTVDSSSGCACQAREPYPRLPWSLESRR